MFRGDLQCSVPSIYRRQKRASKKTTLLDSYFGEDTRTERNIAKIEMHTMYSSATSYYVVVASILSYTQLRTQRVEIVYAREFFDISIARNVKCYEVRIKRRS